MEKQIIYLYATGMSGYKIMKTLNISSKIYVYSILKKYKVTRPYLTCHHPNTNDSYFSKINTDEKAYWLGFLFADGCVRKNNNGISIAVHPKDIELLIRLKTILNLSNKIQLRPQPLAVLQFENKKIHEDLIKHGCVPKKSLVLNAPNINDRFSMSFIRGYFDGDGTIYKRANGKRYGFGIVGTQKLLFWINEKLKINNKLTSHKTVFVLATTDLSKLLEIYKKLYTKKCFCLQRKKKLFKEACAVSNRKIRENNRANTEKAKKILYEKIHGKVCTKCKLKRSINNFRKNYGKTYDNLQTICNDCHKEYNKSRSRAKKLNSERLVSSVEHTD
jgi:hypothetical protein